MKSRLPLAALALAALAASFASVGCAFKATSRSGEGARLSTAKSAIQGGSVDRTHTFAVAIVTNGETCSGALIAPNLVLTARHCVSPGGGDVVDCSVDTFGAPMKPSSFRVTTDAVANQASAFHAVAKVLTPSGKKFCGNDIALLLLADVVSPDEAVPITPAVEFSMTEHPRYQTEIAAIGYGITGPGRSDEGTRHLREHIPLVCTPGDETIPCSSLADYDITAAEFVVKEGVCTGDSGGSAIEQASLESAPVTFGVLSRAAETATRCAEATFTRTDAFKEFLVAGAEEAASAGDYPLPAWAGGTAPQPAGASDAGVPADAAAPAPMSTASSTGCAVAVPDAGRPSWSTTLLAAAVLLLRRRRRALESGRAYFRSQLL